MSSFSFPSDFIDMEIGFNLFGRHFERDARKLLPLRAIIVLRYYASSWSTGIGRSHQYIASTVKMQLYGIGYLP